MNTLNATHARLLRLLAGKRSVSYDELSAILPESVDEQQFDEVLSFLNARGIAVTEEPFVGGRDDDAAATEEELEPDEGAQAELERRKLDDPIRMYFSQMATIPLLSREEEVTLAKDIEDSRARLRDLVYQTRLGQVRAVELLDLVREREVLIEKALDINLIQKGERHRFLEILKRCVRLLKRNITRSDGDFAALAAGAKRSRLQAAARMQKRLARGARVIDKLGVKPLYLCRWADDIMKLARTLEEERRRNGRAARDVRFLEAAYEPLGSFFARAGEILESPIDENPEIIEVNWSHTFAIRDKRLEITAYADRSVQVLADAPSREISAAIKRIRRRFSESQLRAIHLPNKGGSPAA